VQETWGEGGGLRSVMIKVCLSVGCFVSQPSSVSISRHWKLCPMPSIDHHIDQTNHASQNS
jgi:hypothetical protein